MNNSEARFRRIVVLVVLWTAVVTVLRAARLPNDFAESYWLLDYRFGFIKRGLIGSICSGITSILGVPMTASVIAALSLVMLVVLIAVFFGVILDIVRRHQWADGAVLTALVFVSSPFVVMCGHLTGYMDSFLYLATVGSIALILSGRPFAAAVVQVLALLTHEAYLFTGYPLACLAALVAGPDTGVKKGIVRQLAALAVPLVAFAAIFVFQTCAGGKQVLHDNLAVYLGSFDFIAARSKAVAVWQTIGFLDYLRPQVPFFEARCLEPAVMCTVVPTLIAIVYYFHGSAGVRPFSGLSVLLAGAIMAPFAIHAISHDTARISTYAIAGAMLAAWLLARTRPPAGTGRLLLLVAIPAIVLNVFCSMPLMDDERERFTAIERLLLYSPAILLCVAVAVRKTTGSR